MIAPEAGSEIGADRQPAAAPWDGSRRLWSLWDMVNFGFHAAHTILQELQIHIGVSRRNMDFVEESGGYNNPRVKNDPKAPEALTQAEQGVRFIVGSSRNIFGGIGSSHINEAVQRLENWLDQNPKSWHELNARCRALRDTVQIELKEHLYYRYKKIQRSKNFILGERLEEYGNGVPSDNTRNIQRS